MRSNFTYAFAAAILLLMPHVNFGQAPALGTSSEFALFTAVGAFNNTGVATTVTGDVGTNAGAFNAFPPGILIGERHVADPASAQAATDVDVAYSSLSSTTCGTVLGTTLGNGQILTPDVYCLGAASTLNGDLILDGEGDPNSIFIFKIDGALSTSTNSNVILTNGASLCNVYWQVNGQFQLGDFSVFKGTIVANGAIILLEGSSLFGRGLSREGAISLHNNVVSIETPAIASTIVASGPTSFCSGGSVILSGNNNGGTFSNGATTPTTTVNTSGDYFITNAGACGGSVISNHILVTVNGQASCSITGKSNICCVGQSIQLCVPASEGSKYMWTTGSTTNCISVSTAGTYSVTVTTADGCTSTCTKTVTSSTPPPSCTITGKASICQGSSSLLCAPKGSGYTYLWSTGATSRCVLANNGGTFSVKVTKDGKSSICSKTVTVVAPVTCDITGSSTVCQGQTTQLCAPSGAKSYLWSTGATTSCISAGAGKYSVTVTNANGCKSTCKKTVTVSAPSCDIIAGNTTLCQGQSTQLRAPAGVGYSYLWSTGATSRSIVVSNAGTFSVTVNQNGCSTTCSKDVSITDVPCCAITGSSSICEGSSTLLCAPYGSGYTYLWSNGSTSRCATISSGGTVSVTVTKNGLSSTCSKTVTIEAPSCLISGSNTVCNGGSTSLCGPSGSSYTYLWSTGSTSRCIVVTSGGTYSLTATRNGCSNTCTKTVTETSVPSSSISGSDNICEGQTTQLCAPSGTGNAYLWSNGAITRCINVDRGGTFSVKVSKNGCSSTSTKVVILNPNPSCSIEGNLYPSTGQTTTLCATSDLRSYQWNTGATTQCITVNCSGIYSVVTESNSGCFSLCGVSVVYATSSTSSAARMASPKDNNISSEGNMKVNAYPNPFKSKAVIEFQTTESNSHVLIELYSLTGNKMITLLNSEVKETGFHKVEVNAGDLPSGIYFYKIVNGNQAINRRLILSR